MLGISKKKESSPEIRQFCFWGQEVRTAFYFTTPRNREQVGVLRALLNWQRSGANWHAHLNRVYDHQSQQPPCPHYLYSHHGSQPLFLMYSLLTHNSHPSAQTVTPKDICDYIAPQVRRCKTTTSPRTDLLPGRLGTHNPCTTNMPPGVRRQVLQVISNDIFTAICQQQCGCCTRCLVLRKSIYIKNLLRNE